MLVNNSLDLGAEVPGSVTGSVATFTLVRFGSLEWINEDRASSILLHVTTDGSMDILYMSMNASWTILETRLWIIDSIQSGRAGLTYLTVLFSEWRICFSSSRSQIPSACLTLVWLAFLARLHYPVIHQCHLSWTRTMSLVVLSYKFIALLLVWAPVKWGKTGLSGCPLTGFSKPWYRINLSLYGSAWFWLQGSRNWIKY